MKLKTLTMAVMAASLGLSTAAVQAESSWYGSVRIGYEYNDAREDESRFRNWASRLGFQGESEIAPGLIGFGKYEFGIGTDDSDDRGINRTRKAYVGLKGDFGRVWIGQDYHTFYNFITVKHDIPWWGSGNGTVSNDTYLGRNGEALSYDKKLANGVSFGATAYLADDLEGDGYELAVNFPILGGAHNVALGVHNDTGVNADGTVADGDGDFVYGLAANGKVGEFSYGAAYTDRDEGRATSGSAYDIHLEFNKFYVNFGQADLDNGREPYGVTLGYTWNIGKKTLMWFEAQQTDADDGSDETNIFRAALKYDF